MVTVNAANGPALRKGFLLSPTELDDLQLDSKGQPNDNSQVPLDQGKYAATVVAAQLAGHDIERVLPREVMQRNNSKAQKQPLGWVTCKK